METRRVIVAAEGQALRIDAEHHGIPDVGCAIVFAAVILSCTMLYTASVVVEAIKPILEHCVR